MAKPLGVVNTPPVYALGLARALAGTGYSLVEVAEPLPWLRQHHPATLLIGVETPGDFEVVVNLKAEDPDVVVVTLLGAVSVETVHASLRAGATGWIGIDARVEDVMLTLAAADENKAIIPTSLARTLLDERPAPNASAPITETELAWLRALAAGETVVELGNRLGYSEREMYRRLRRAYTVIGVGGKTEALMYLAKRGLLD